MVENEERRNKSDSDFVETLIDDLKVKVEVNYITGLGSSKSGKVRPIKVVFANEKEKESVIGSLPALKDYQQYKSEN